MVNWCSTGRRQAVRCVGGGWVGVGGGGWELIILAAGALFRCSLLVQTACDDASCSCCSRIVCGCIYFIMRVQDGAGGGPLLLSVIMQYYEHASTLTTSVHRLLLHPSTELLIHADSNTTDDHAAFAHVRRQHGSDRLRIVHSPNIHEIRGYNKCARLARAPVLLFTQDDALPPAGPAWADFIINAFSILGPRLDALGLLSGKVCTGTVPGKQQCRKLGQCGAAERPPGLPMTPTYDRGGSSEQELNASTDNLVQPLQYVDVLVMGPIAVRAAVFADTGGFNESYSKVGKPGIGFEGAWASKMWASGHSIAVSCASPALLFANGCGGRGSLSSEAKRRERVETAYRNTALWTSEFPRPHGLSGVRARVDMAQGALEANATILSPLSHGLGCLSSCPKHMMSWQALTSPLCMGKGHHP